MKKENLNKSINIPSIEGAYIWENMVRGEILSLDHVGAVSFSLEQIKLIKEGMKTKKQGNKLNSNDMINLKFKANVKDGKGVIAMKRKKMKSVGEEIEKLNKKRESLSKKVELEILDKKIKNKEDYILKLQKDIELIKSEMEDAELRGKWEGINNVELREKLYKDGFTIDFVNEKTKKVKSVHYVEYKRSSAKSRNGMDLFIREGLSDEMKKWSRMYLPFKPNQKVDLASLRSYESLVSSTITELITIRPENMLLIDDIEHTFKYPANVIRKSEETGHLESYFEHEAEITNNLFDGQSLLEDCEEYFPDDTSMLLLRSHFFKSCAFRCSLQKWLQDRCPENTPYEEFKVYDMFNRPMLAKDVKFVFCPSSLKCLKFSDVIGSKAEMYDYWKELIGEKENSVLGVVKREKESKRGYDDEGRILNQTSYQILNSMQLSKETVHDIVSYEKMFIDRLKNDDDFFANYAYENRNEVNSNAMFVDLYRTNKEIVNLQMFKDFRSRLINDHIDHIKKGKVRIPSDYAVILAEPIAMLKSITREFDIEKTEMTLKPGEIYTKLHDFGKELILTRNPHTSGSNVVVATNRDNKDISTYFGNLSKNIVIIPLRNIPLQDRFSGSDQDSDVLLIVDSPDMLPEARRCYEEYPVCVNGIKPKNKPYTLNQESKAELDSELSSSTFNIGRVVNTSQLFMSVYNDYLNRGKAVPKKVLNRINVLSILAGLCIDMCKKQVNIDIDDELEYLTKDLKLKYRIDIKKKKVDDEEVEEEVKVELKPLFWTKVSANKNVGKKLTHYKTTMDFLQIEMKDTPDSTRRDAIPLSEFIKDYNKSLSDRKQRDKIYSIGEELQNKQSKVFIKYVGEDDETKEERYEALDNSYDFYISKLGRLSVKYHTMCDIIARLEDCSFRVRLMNALYKSNKELFLSVFKQG